jgi:predicted NUDIX family NTP pyrophosphohydrolase
MTARSAGILLYRQVSGELQVFLVHMGGPYFSHKDAGAWSIPKGEYGSDEEPLRAAQREFAEETGLVLEGSISAARDGQATQRKAGERLGEARRLRSGAVAQQPLFARVAASQR